MSRRVYLLGVGLALVALALAFTDWALSLRPGVTEVNVRRVKPGMTLAEVEAIFGCRWRAGFINNGSPAEVSFEWEGARGAAAVRFDLGQRARQATWHRRHQADSLFHRLRVWLGW
jgi:hypothetical protein